MVGREGLKVFLVFPFLELHITVMTQSILSHSLFSYDKVFIILLEQKL